MNENLLLLSTHECDLEGLAPEMFIKVLSVKEHYSLLRSKR